MRVHYIQHVAFEGLGYIAQWLQENGHSVTATCVWEKAVFPAVDDFDVLIIMGGPMGVYDDHQYSWLAEEKNFIFDAIRAEKRILGICLGAQLLASVLGATVFTNKHKEIGWFPITIDASFAGWLGAPAPEVLNVFHWHGDKFDNPYGGTIHAASAACNHQLFTFNDNMIGLQFHLEATPQTIAEMLHHGRQELTDGDYVQSADVILQRASFDAPNQLMGQILHRLCSVVGE